MSVINRLLEEHDKNPTAAAQELREVDPVSLSQSSLSSYSWLLNHVLGELNNAWSDACERQQALVSLREELPPSVHRGHAVAALYSGKPLEAWDAQARYAAISGTPKVEADVIVRLGVLQCSPQGEAEQNSFQVVLRDALTQIASWNVSKETATALGSTLNNIVSHWLEDNAQPSPPVAELMQEAAATSQKMWKLAGTWVNVERGYYLRALVANRLSLWELARDAAKEGLRIIEANGEEDVDRATHLVELARAYRGLSEVQKQNEARKQAFAIADTFTDPGLREWFDSKAVGI